MKQPLNVTVFCASSSAVDERFKELAEQFGKRLAAHGCTLVYGGGDIGLMGILARAVHAEGGHVVGIIPYALRKIEGIAYETADELIMTDTMHERKAQMYERADVFVALPGGMGTLEEFLEVVTLKKLGYHDHPIFLLSPEGFFDKLLTFFAELEQQRFMSRADPELFETIDDVETLFQKEPFLSQTAV